MGLGTFLQLLPGQCKAVEHHQGAMQLYKPGRLVRKSSAALYVKTKYWGPQ